MSASIIKNQPLTTIIQSCEEESQRPKAEESGFCFELFHRAISLEEEEAWSAIQAQYHKLMRQWVLKSVKDMVTGEDVDDLVQDSFLKFWRTLSQKEAELGASFPHVGAVLRYLQQCAVTACLDFQRKVQRREKMQSALLKTAEATGVSASFSTRLEVDERMQRIQDWLKKNLATEQEKMVIALSFEQGLTPAQIATQYSHLFVTVREVNKVKERVLKRARRAFSAK